MKDDCILRVQSICKSFTKTVALNNVEFELKKGEVHALVGANGAGKSTLIKILTGAYQCDSGEIFLNGKKVKINSPSDSKALGISAVYQEFSLANNLSVAENIFMGKLPTGDAVLLT